MGRLAIVCLECRRREFDKPDWRCPNHPTKCVVQANAAYFGSPVETPAVKGLKTVKPDMRRTR